MEEGDRGLEHISKILPRIFTEGGRTEWRKLPEPPFDSPIEAIFAENCIKHLARNVHADKQVKIPTKHGDFFTVSLESSLRFCLPTSAH